MIRLQPAALEAAEHSACTYCPVSELQLAVLLGQSNPDNEPLWTGHATDADTLPQEAQQRLSLLHRIYLRLRQAAPPHHPELANRWVFEPGVLEPITEDSILEYLLAAPSVARFDAVHRFLDAMVGSSPAGSTQ